MPADCSPERSDFARVESLHVEAVVTCGPSRQIPAPVFPAQRTKPSVVLSALPSAFQTAFADLIEHDVRSA